MSACFEINSKEKEVNCDDNEILSDSDPEGDRLDMKDLLGKCENKVLKNKLKEYEKTKTREPKGIK